jgi:hypothetical protein
VVGRKKRGDIYRKTDGHCAYCGRELDPFENWHIEHMTARINGGENAIENLVPACHSCNLRKRSKDVEEFRDWILGGSASQLLKIREKLDFAIPMVGDNTIKDIRADIDELVTKLSDTPVTFYVDGLLD